MYIGNIDAILCNTEYERGVERPDGRYSYDLYSFDEKSYEGGIRGTSCLLYTSGLFAFGLFTLTDNDNALYLTVNFLSEHVLDLHNCFLLSLIHI